MSDPDQELSVEERGETNPPAETLPSEKLDAEQASPQTKPICSQEQFDGFVEHLKQVLPPPRPYKVTVIRKRFDDRENLSGLCELQGKKFTITIEENLTELETAHILIHEWAHMIAWRPANPYHTDHGFDWGGCYALVFCRFYGVL